MLRGMPRKVLTPLRRQQIKMPIDRKIKKGGLAPAQGVLDLIKKYSQLYR